MELCRHRHPNFWARYSQQIYMQVTKVFEHVYLTMRKSKKLFEQHVPLSDLPPRLPQGAELWLAESLQCPTLTDPTARGSSNALLLQFLYIWGKKPHLLPSGTQKARLRDKFVSVTTAQYGGVQYNLYVLYFGAPIQSIPMRKDQNERLSNFRYMHFKTT